MSVFILVLDAVHQLFDKMDAQTADGTLLGREGGVYLALGCRIERLAAVADDKSQAVALRQSGDIYIAFRAFGISITHHVDNGLLQGEVHLHRCHHIDTMRFADLFDEGGQLRHLLNVVGQRKGL